MKNTSVLRRGELREVDGMNHELMEVRRKLEELVKRIERLEKELRDDKGS